MLLWHTPLLAQTEKLQEGDILFQDLDCGPFCDAIEKVTEGVDGRDFSHCGLLVKDAAGQWAVLEAVSAGVVMTPLPKFLERENRAEMVVGRLRQKQQGLLPKALAHGKKLLGKPYDQVFDMENDAYYCSEMIYEVFKQANEGQPIFELYPMTYIDPGTGKLFPAWEEYFEELGVEVPEGKPGLNPGSLSRSEHLEIFIISKEVGR